VGILFFILILMLYPYESQIPVIEQAIESAKGNQKELTGREFTKRRSPSVSGARNMLVTMV